MEKSKPNEEEIDELSIAVFAGCLGNLSLLDFSEFNMKFVKIDSDELKKFLKSTQHNVDEFKDHNQKLFDEFKEEKHFYGEHLFVLLPIDLEKPVNESDNGFVREILLVMFPSDFTLHIEIHFQFFDKKTLWWNSCSEWHFNVSDFDNYYDNFLYFPDKLSKEINEFIKVYIQRKPKIKFLKTIVSSYLHCFSEYQYPHLLFLSLCICLEATTDSRTELTYRIRRNYTILCGKDEFESELIFNSVNKLYSLRSAIVHGSDYNYKKVEEFMPYIRSLASRLIIEIISHNIDDIKTLNDVINKKGFGSKDKLSEGYKEYLPNVKVATDLWQKLE